MILEANAKINLLLDILGRTDDGYHTVYMVMQSVGIGDRVTVTENGKAGTIELTCSNEKLPSDKTNIGWKAAEAFFKATGIKNPGISIDIEKHIPFAAGLAGGSADAAAVLVGLNRMLGADLNDRELCRIGLEVGADVPFCIQGGTMLSLDIGGVLAPLPDVPGDYYVLVKPDQDVNTGKAYAAFDQAHNVRHLRRDEFLHAIVRGNFEDMYDMVGNVFEQFVAVDDRVEIKAIMRGTGAECYCMSGSGPTIYGIFHTEEEAEACVEALKGKGFENVFLCRPEKEGVKIIEE